MCNERVWKKGQEEVRDFLQEKPWSEAVCGILTEFLHLCAIPHQSGHEEAVSDMILRRAAALGFAAERDPSNNVWVSIPAAEGMEDSPAVMIQAHVDMVVAVEPGKFDPVTDTVCPVIDGGLLKTDGCSSLGADNGVGVALMLYIMEHRELVKGPLKLLFTTGEEVGLKGAKAIDPAVFEGVSYLINLDGFHGDRAVVGCMSGKRETYYHPLHTVQAMPGSVGLSIEISGLRGGHSGEDIGERRLNAIRLMAEMLFCLFSLEFPVEIAAIDGGTGANVIPRSCSACLAVHPDKLEAVKEQLRTEFDFVVSAYTSAEHTPSLTLTEEPAPRRVFRKELTQDILGAIRLENTGVYAMSHQARGQVGGSSNLGRVVTGENQIEIDVMTRCETEELEREIITQHQHIARQYGLSIGVVGYNAWHQTMVNPLTDAVKAVYRRETGREIDVTVAQVGLEPAYFRAKAPWLTMVTLGADIEDAHSTSERVHIDSIDTMYRLVAGVLSEIK